MMKTKLLASLLLVASLFSQTQGSVYFLGTSGLTTVQTVKATPGELLGMHTLNSTAAVCFIQFFNATAANVTLGTTIPWFVIGMVASNQNLQFPAIRVPFSTALSIAATTTTSGSTTCAVNGAMYYH